LNSKLHVVCDGNGKPLALLLTEGQMSDHKGAQIMLSALPPASALIADKGYDSDWFREALKARGTETCIPPTRSRKTPLDYDRALYRQRHKIENLFAKLKDWRRISTRYDRCGHTFFSAISLTLALLWQIWRACVGEWLLTVGTSRRWRAREEVKDGLPDGRHGRLRGWPSDSFFSVPLL